MYGLPSSVNGGAIGSNPLLVFLIEANTFATASAASVYSVSLIVPGSLGVISVRFPSSV